MNENERLLLESLSKEFESADQVAAKSGLAKSALMSAAAALEAEGLVEVKKKERKLVSLTPEGRSYFEKGTPERRLCAAVSAGKELEFGTAVKKAGLAGHEAPVALQWAVKNGWAVVKKDGGKTVVSCSSLKEGEVEAALKKIGAKQVGAEAVEKHVLEILEKRKLVEFKEEKEISLRAAAKGAAALARQENVVSQLTPEMLKTGAWKGRKFKEYDLKTVVAPVQAGGKHFYKEFIGRIKEHLVSMGFEEVQGPLVETEFRNMDVLFMAQDHPAREIHDIFMLEEPSKGSLPDKLVERVKWAHEVGGKGSKGWRYKWDPAVAARLVLRSQTTAVSGRRLAQGVKPPFRMFCIGKCFRPDEIDWKHFIEFYQLEGIVVDDGISFRELLGYLKTFATKVFGAKEVGFVPSYYPFTEPSVDLVGKIGDKWVELGGAGMFRPEMLEALNVGVPVLAWGLGLDRFAMRTLGVKDIRDLSGSDMELIRRK
ncbi:MAG: phenylalanine--tRNA ligase subunit alpha [Candidatus Micrarchaeota archaeon]|nr:phenylalanine--tRNA ligase subunit alpha [Candidatus Micrarchaeota archaeon]